MTQEQFDTAVVDQVKHCMELLTAKGREYTQDMETIPELDRLSHFKKAAALMGQSPEQALMGMLSKHLVSISDMCCEKYYYFPKEMWEEKITDSINYLLILRAMIEEEANEQD